MNQSKYSFRAMNQVWWLVVTSLLGESCFYSRSLTGIDVNGSYITLSELNVAADNPNLVVVRASLRQISGDPIAGQSIRLQSSLAEGIQITPETIETDEAGLAQFTIQPKNVGVYQLQLAMKAGDSFFPIPSATSALNVFAPSFLPGLPRNTKINTQVLVLKEDGKKPPRYLGTIQFSSTDPLAVLPERSAMQENDYGNRIYTQSVVFKTDGLQTVVVKDLVTGKVFSSQQYLVVPPLEEGYQGRVSVSKTTAVADNTDIINLESFVVNGYGEPVQDTAIDWRISGDRNTYSLTSKTDAQGKAFNQLVSTKAETKTITAIIEGPNGAITTNQVEVTFQAGDANKLSFNVQPGALPAGTYWNQAPSVQVLDQYNNVATTFQGNVSLELVGAAPGITLEGNIQVPTSFGQASFTYVSIARAGTNYALSATSPGLLSTQSQFFSVVNGAATHLAFEDPNFTVPATIVAGEVLPTCTLKVLDAYDNLVLDSNLPVQTSIGNNLVGAVLEGTTSISPSNGRVILSNLSIAKAGSNYKLDFTLANTIGLSSNTFSITNGDPNQAMTTLQPTTQTTIANGVDQATLELLVRDRYGNTVSGITAVFDGAPVYDTLVAPPLLESVTDSNGRITATISSQRVEAKAILANLYADSNILVAPLFSVSLSPTSVFVAGPAVGTFSTISLDPNDTQVADGNSIVTVSVHFEDQYRNPVANRQVAFVGSGDSNDIFLPIEKLTNTAGNLVQFMTATKAEIKTVTATLDVPLQANITFVNGPSDVNRSFLEAIPEVIVADGIQVATLRATMRDKYDNPLGNVSVGFFTLGLEVYFDNNGFAITDPNGIATVTLRSPVPQDKIMGFPTSNGFYMKTVPFVLPLCTTNLAMPLAPITLTPISPTALYSKDVDSDGKADIIALAPDSNSLMFLGNSGKATFRSPQIISFSDQASDVVIADVNGDGKQDLMVTNLQSNQLTVLRNHGLDSNQNIILSTVVVASGLPNIDLPRAVAMADFNRDGKLDVVVANQNSNKVFLFQNTTNIAQVCDPNALDPNDRPNSSNCQRPQFDTPAVDQNQLVGAEPWDLVTADLNRDAVMDLVTANRAGNSISIINGGVVGANAVLSASTNVATGGNSPIAVKLADINNDGILDIITANQSGSFSAFIGSIVTSVYSVAPAVVYSTDPNNGILQDIQIADINSDGRLDTIISQSQQALSVYYNNGNGTFNANPNTFSTGTSPNGILSFDFNYDGKLDVALASSDANRINILFGKQGGEFAAPQTTVIGQEPIAMLAIDLTHDDRKDIVVINRGDSNVAVILDTTSPINGPNFSGQSFSAPTLYDAGPSPSMAQAGDINGDTHVDLMIINPNQPLVHMLAGDGNGSLAAPVAISINEPAAGIALEDMNKDGRLDMALSLPNAQQVAIFFGQVGGQFAAPVTYAVGQKPSVLKAVDTNQDGNTDLLVVNADEASVSILLGSANGAFAAAYEYDVGSPARDIWLADSDRDGFLDLISSHPASKQIKVHLGNGLGQFTLGSTYAAGGDGTVLSMADFNSDRFLDIAVVYPTSDAFGILKGRGDGTFSDPMVYMTSKSPNYIISEDFEKRNDPYIYILSQDENAMAKYKRNECIP